MRPFLCSRPTLSVPGRYFALVLLALIFPLAIASLVGFASAAPVKKGVGGKIVITGTEYPNGACSVGVELAFPSMRGATSYAIIYTDNGTKISTGAPPFADGNAKAGTHRIGIAGYNASLCDGVGAIVAGYQARFRGPVTVVATFPDDFEPKPEIWGKITASLCGPKACRKEGLSGVVVKALPLSGGPIPSAVTDDDGEYRIPVKKGRYRVLPSLRNLAFTPDRVVVTAEGFGPRNVDFETCAAGSHATSVAARAPDTFCRILDIQRSPHPKLQHLPVQIQYQGIGWDPKDGPITITLDGQKITTIAAAATFKGNIGTERWGYRSNLSDGKLICGAVVGAIQGSVAIRRPVKADAGAVVLYSDDPRIKVGEGYCRNEDATFLITTKGTIIALELASEHIRRFQNGETSAFAINKGESLCWDLTANQGSVTIRRNLNGTFTAKKSEKKCP